MKRLAYIVLFLAAAPMTAQASPKGDFKTLLDEHWATANREQVFFRTDPDAWRMQGKLAEFTTAARARRQHYNEAVLERLASIDVAALPAEQQLSYRLFDYERLAEQESYRQPDHLFPITSMFGYHSYFADAPANMSFLTIRDYEDYLVSLDDFPRFNREHLDLMREAVSRGYTQQCDAMQGVRAGIQALIVNDPAASALHGPFERFPSSIPAKQQADIGERGTALIAQKIIPAFRELLQFFDTDYMPNCRKAAGVGQLEGGSDFYAWRVRYFTTTDMTPAEIHALGMSELARIRREMDSIIDASGFEGDFAAFLQFLRTDPRFYARDVTELLGRAALIAKTAEGELPRFFTVLPRGTYNIKASPGRGSYYVGSAGDGTTSGTYFVGTAGLDAQPLYAGALTCTRACPVTICNRHWQMELDVPAFRRTVSLAFGEGRGLYSESLGREMGFYRDPYSDFGRLTYEAWRACRLVVDTGMHAFGWTREQAIDYMLQNTALSELEIKSEVDRYITWPGQALAYKIGEIRIRAMREKAERALGSDFDLRRYHDTVIGSGSLPIDILDALVDAWIENELRNAGG
jgi:uncharacterized protein (DUF885 family)